MVSRLRLLIPLIAVFSSLLTLDKVGLERIVEVSINILESEPLGILTGDYYRIVINGVEEELHF